MMEIQMTEITNEVSSMIRFWQTQSPKDSAEKLVGNVVRYFKMKPGTAWIIVTRLRNIEHTQQQGG